jgi:hypothetical protein
VFSVFATALTVAAFLGTAARATPPGSNGLIIYQAMVGKHIQLFTVEPDGSGARQLTHFSSSDAVHAAWSPDGSEIVFERDFPKQAGVYTMDVSGGGLKSLTPHGSRGYRRTRRTVDDRIRPVPARRRAWLMRTTERLRQLITTVLPARRVSLRGQSRPAGRQADRLRAHHHRTKTAVFVVNVDGSGLKQLTPWHLGVSKLTGLRTARRS